MRVFARIKHRRSRLIMSLVLNTQTHSVLSDGGVWGGVNVEVAMEEKILDT